MVAAPGTEIACSAPVWLATKHILNRKETTFVIYIMLPGGNVSRRILFTMIVILSTAPRPGVLAESSNQEERRSVDVKHTGSMVDPTYGSPAIPATEISNRTFKGEDLCLL